MYVYMGQLRWKDIVPYEQDFWKKNRIDLIQDEVIGIEDHKKEIVTALGKSIRYDKLIIATGSKSNTLNLPGESASNVCSLYSSQDLEAITAISSNIGKAVIIGGGLIGVELAEMFRSRNISVTMLVRENGFMDFIFPKEESDLISEQIRSHGVDLRLSTEVQRLNASGSNLITSVTTTSGENIPCDFVGMTIGVSPNISWLKNTMVETNIGVRIDDFLQTNLPDIYAIGDCAELRTTKPGRNAIEPIWYTGRMMGETVAHTLTGQPTHYNPGTWFNSAKFFDLEYQVYGDIQPNLPAHQDSVFCINPKNKRSLRINYLKSGSVIGFNLLGTRFRQAVCEKWIREQTSIEHVLENLELAVFDPEFSTHDCEQLRVAYAEKIGVKLFAKSKPNYNLVHRFLNNAIISKK